MSRAFSCIAPKSPLPLALLRMALGGFILLSPEPWQARELARHLGTGDEGLLFPPEGMHWFLPAARWFAPHLQVAHWALNIAAVTTSLGIFTRASLALLSATYFLLFGLAQFSGTVTHSMHLWWLLLLLLASPSGDGLSVDAWRKRRSQLHPAPSRQAAVALFGARLLLACVYLFPGIAKLKASGLQWALSDNLLTQMRFKWFMAGEVPWPRIDQWPSLLEFGALCVLVFEVSFIGLIWFGWGRWVAVVAGLVFHGLAAHFLFIHFVGLWGCYVVFWDGPKVPNSAPLATPDRPWLSGLVSAALLVGVVVQGARGQTQAFPFACYPDFARRPASYITDLALDVALPNGKWSTLRYPRKRAPQTWGAVWRMLGLYGGGVDRQALKAYAQHWLSSEAANTFWREHPRGSTGADDEPLRVRFFAEEYSLDPETYTLPPRRRRLILEDTLPSPRP